MIDRFEAVNEMTLETMSPGDYEVEVASGHLDDS